MDLKQIQELIKLVKKADLGELKVKEGDFSITIKNKGSETVAYSQPVVTAAPAPVQQIVKAETVAEAKPVQTATVTSDNVSTFKSPMVGTFYRKPGADKEPFVKVGDVVKAGDVLCIVEAMKLFNEIEFDGTEGRIVKILAEDSSPVEYDQPLFLIEKI